MGRPFISALSGLPNAEIVNSALIGVSGTVGISTPSRLSGWESNVTVKLLEQGCWRIQGLAGLRNLDLHEALGITENLFDVSNGFSALTFLGNPIAAPPKGK